MKTYRFGRYAALAFTATIAAASLGSGPAFAAQGGIGEITQVTVQATVKSVDMATRHAVLVGADGQSFTVKVGDQARNLDQVKPGDKVVATYYRSVAFVLSARNAEVPENSLSLAAARSPKGRLPAGLAESRTMVSGTVVGIDLANHTLQLVDPSGGEVHTVEVTDPARRKRMSDIKVGDRLTAHVTEAFLVDVQRQ